MSDALRIAVVPGDGIGVEVIAEAVRRPGGGGRRRPAARSRLTPFDWGAEHYLKTGVTLPDGALDDAAATDFDAILLGAMGDPRVPDNRHAADILLGLRFRLDLYVNYRPVRLFHERLCPLKGARPQDVDFVVFRENTEGLYVMMGGNFKKDTPDEVATEIDLNTRKGVERIIRHAFEYAQAHGPHEGGDGGQVERARPRPRPLAARLQGGGRRVPGHRGHATSTWTTSRCRWCASRAQFQVIVTSNMFGDIVTDLGGRPAGRPGHGRLGQHPSRAAEPVRARARLGAAARRQERRQPDGRDPHRGADARAPRLDGGGARASRTPCAGRWRTTHDHGRHRRLARHARGRRRDRRAPAREPSEARSSW